MPALKMLGRRWLLASDDVPMLAICPTIFHGAWCVALFVSWLVLDRPSDCREGAKYTVALAGLAFTYLFNFLLGCWLIHEGLKGTIFETEKRKRVGPLCALSVISFLVELGWTIYGTVVMYMTPPKCLLTNHEIWSPNGVMNAMIWATWAILITTAVLLILAFNCFPDFQSQRSWERRCRCITICCCCQWAAPKNHGEDQEAPYARLAALFSEVFGLVDLTPTDTLAAFFLVSALQRANRAAVLKDVLSDEEVLHPEPPEIASQVSATSATSTDPILLDPDVPAATKRRLADQIRLSENFPDPDHVPTLFTPSGQAAQYREDWGVEETGKRHAEFWDLKEVSSHDVDEAAHYCRYAFAAYGYLLYIWSQPQYKGWCGLCCGRRFGLWLSPLKRYFQAFTAQSVVPDLKFNNAMNREAMQQMTGLEDHDIVFVRYENAALDRHCLPYFIAVDKSTHSIVLSIRGTLSLEDCMTDFLCEPAALNEWIAGAKSGKGTPKSFDDEAPAVQLAQRGNRVTAHAGILEAAKAVVNDLQRTGELRALIENKMPPHRPALQKENRTTHPSHDCRGWRVVVTGHSLGAGASVLVALYLRNYFKDVFCWAFSPPGGLAEPSVAEACKTFCTSVALGKDWIPRLTLASFEQLRDEMIMAAARCKVSKTRFLIGLIRGKRWDGREEKLFCKPGEAHLPSEAKALLHSYSQSVERTRSDRDRYRMARTFVLPGRLMYIRPLKHKPHVKKQARRYDAYWAKPEDLHGEGIIVSPRMMADHMPDYITSVLGKMARRRRKEDPDFSSRVGPAVGSGAQHVEGPARSHLAIDIDTESEDEDEDDLSQDSNAIASQAPSSSTSRRKRNQ